MKKGAIYAGIIAVVGLALCWFLRRGHDKAVDRAINSATLGPTEQTKFIVDPRRHTVTTVTRRADGGTDTRATFLPSTGASVSVGLDKSVLVVGRTWGTEVNPFVGCALGSDLLGRAALGLNLFYIQRWEAGGGLLMGSDVRDARLFAHVSYNVYGNMYVALGVDHKRTAHLMAGLKF